MCNKSVRLIVAIVAALSGSTTSGKDMYPIVEAKRKATEAGCAK